MPVTIPEGQVYLDNASTSYPKPPAVAEAVAKAVTDVSLTTGRGTSFCEINPDDIVKNTRKLVCKLFNGSDPSRVIFTYSATDSLNLVLFGSLKEDDHVLISALEHHAVSRAVHYLRENRGVDFDVMPSDADGRIIPERIGEVVQPRTCLACISHISNVGGTVQPLREIGAELLRLNVPFMVDASQSAGCHAIDMQAMNLDAVAAPGHKSLLGLPGSGVLYLGERLKPAPLRVGGTGVKSELYHLPPELPVYYESGTPNVLGIIALEVSLGFIFEQTVDVIERRHHELSARMLAGLLGHPRITVAGPTNPALRAPVISFTVDGRETRDVSRLLADKYHIAHRGGLHCAPMAHEFFGTDKLGGAVRVSPAYLTPESDVDYFFDALDEILAQH